MRNLIIISIFCLACKNSSQNNQTSSDNSTTSSQKNLPDSNIIQKNIWVDRLNGQKFPLPDSIGGKPVSFYLDISKVEPIAKALYNGQFRPTDNDSTTQEQIS